MGFGRLWLCTTAVVLFAASGMALDVEAIVQRNEGAVLVIVGERADNGARVQGSGVCVHPDGYVLATAHQVIGVKNLSGRLVSGETFGLEVVDVEQSLEATLLKAEKPLPVYVSIGDADTLRSGAPLVSIAAPMNLDFSTVPGTVSHPNRTYGGYPVMQVTLTASHGSSGGPVFDRRGALTGLISGELEEVDFTIVNRINNFYPMLRRHGIPVRETPLPGDHETVLVPVAGVSEAEFRAIEAYNRGVSAVEPEEKVEAYALAVKLLPDFFEGMFNMGVAAHAAGDADHAHRAYARAAKLRPDSVAVKRNMGRLLLAEGQPPAAVAEFEGALKLAPSDPQSHNDLGEACRQAGQAARAEEAFLKALELRPKYPAAHFNLGLLYANNEHPKEAAAHFRAYLELSPGASDAGQVREWITKLE